MEFVKKEIQANHVKLAKTMQVTVDKDLNVPDSRPDMEKIVQVKGEVRIDEIEVMSERIHLRGVLLVKILYHTAESGPALSSFSGAVDLEEYINADGIGTADDVRISVELDDLNVVMIHSRKLGVRALLTFRAGVSEMKKVDAAVSVKDDYVEQQTETIYVTGMTFHRKDSCRVKGEYKLPVSKPNIKELVWEDMALRSPEIRMLPGRIQIRGEMEVFFLYTGEEEHVPMQHIVWEFPFTTEVECPECREDMVGNIQVRKGNGRLEVKPDEDGEERILALEIQLNVDMKGYEEEKISVLKDLYGVDREIMPRYQPFYYENLILKNNAKVKVQRRFPVREIRGNVLQLIHADGSVKMDEMEQRKEGIFVEGVILAELLLITDEDFCPISGMTQLIPFSQLVEVKNSGENMTFELEARLEEIYAAMPDGDEIEIKAVISLDVIAFSAGEGKVITGAVESPYNYEMRNEIPGVAVYIAPKEESVWNVAKTYASSVDTICQMNQLESPNLKQGQKVLVVKKVKELL